MGEAKLSYWFCTRSLQCVKIIFEVTFLFSCIFWGKKIVKISGGQCQKKKIRGTMSENFRGRQQAEKVSTWLLSSGQDFSKNFLDLKHVLKVYFKPSWKNQEFLFLPLPSKPVSMKNDHLKWTEPRVIKYKNKYRK